MSNFKTTDGKPTITRSIAEDIITNTSAKALPAVTLPFISVQKKKEAQHVTPQQKIVQQKLKVGGDSGWTVTDSLENLMHARPLAWDEMIDQLDEGINKAADDIPKQQELQALKQELESKPVLYKKQLTRWMDDRPRAQKAYGKHPVYGRKQQNREYNNWIEVAIALTGWVKAKPGRKLEKALAQEVYNNPELEALLNSLVQKVRVKIESLKVTHPVRYLEIVNELQSDKTLVRSIKGNEKQSETLYGHYEKEMSKAADEFGHEELKVVYKNKWEILNAPESFRLRDKIIFLHDITEYFGKHQPWNPVTAGQHLIPVDNETDARVTTAVDITGERTASESALTKEKDKVKDKQARGMGLTTASRDEAAPSTRFARSLNLPVWAGQSMTTVRMLNMAQWAGGRTPEFNALAQGIFAFWRLEYNHTSDFAYHTLHEVMDMAKNFGVTYRTPPAPGGSTYDYDKINEAYIRPYVGELITNIAKMFASLAEETGHNTWTSEEAKGLAIKNLQTLQPKIEAINGWWNGFDFQADTGTRKQQLTKTLQGINFIQMDLGQLKNLIMLRSSALQKGFWG